VTDEAQELSPLEKVDTIAEREAAPLNRTFRAQVRRALTMKGGKLLAGVVFAVLLAGCAGEHDSMAHQAGFARTDVSRYVAAMSEQPGQLALKHQCGHQRSWTRLEGWSTENE